MFKTVFKTGCLKQGVINLTTLVESTDGIKIRFFKKRFIGFFGPSILQNSVCLKSKKRPGEKILSGPKDQKGK